MDSVCILFSFKGEKYFFFCDFLTFRQRFSSLRWNFLKVYERTAQMNWIFHSRLLAHLLARCSFYLLFSLFLFHRSAHALFYSFHFVNQFTSECLLTTDAASSSATTTTTTTTTKTGTTMAITMEIRITEDNGPCNGDRDGNDDGILYFVYTIHNTHWV